MTNCILCRWFPKCPVSRVSISNSFSLYVVLLKHHLLSTLAYLIDQLKLCGVRASNLPHIGNSIFDEPTHCHLFLVVIANRPLEVSEHTNRGWWIGRLVLLNKTWLDILMECCVFSVLRQRVSPTIRYVWDIYYHCWQRRGLRRNLTKYIQFDRLIKFNVIIVWFL